MPGPLALAQAREENRASKAAGVDLLGLWRTGMVDWVASQGWLLKILEEQPKIRPPLQARVPSLAAPRCFSFSGGDWPRVALL